MTSLKWQRYAERYVTLFGATKTFQPFHTAIQRKTCFIRQFISVFDAIRRFLVLYQTFPYIESSGSRYNMYKTEFDLKMSEISNFAGKWVKTMPEILTPMGSTCAWQLFSRCL